jgi:16S rRNA (uracil1498-N3)-methyltransferase
LNRLVALPDEVSGRRISVTGERAEHVAVTLKKKEGDEIRIGVARQGRGVGTIVSLRKAHIEIEFAELAPEAAPDVALIVALPRPLAVSRLLHTASSFGVRHIDLIGAWKVERSYFHSPRLTATRLTSDARWGAEQGGHAWVPTVTVHERFRPFLEDHFPRAQQGLELANRTVFDGSGALRLSVAQIASGPSWMAFGPEGGWIEPELASFARAGFAVARLDTPILTTEIAIAAALGQRALLKGS